MSQKNDLLTLPFMMSVKHVDNNDLLVTMWEKGLRGKSWRILKDLNMNLSASIKTRFGPTREVQMEVGGK